jgi:hypothetical protein
MNQKRGYINGWMVVSIVLILGIIGGGIYMMMKNQTGTTALSGTTLTTTVNEIDLRPTDMVPSPTEMVSPTPAGKKVSAGIKNQFFSPYTVMVPAGWTDAQTNNTASNTLTITKGEYVLTISQAAGGGGSCLYPGDNPGAMAQVFTSFVGITGTFSQFRRGMVDSTNYTVCEQKSSGFGFPTTVGYITYSTPTSADQTVLAEMDQMVAGITK